MIFTRDCSATARRYRYIIYNHRLRPAVLAKGVTHYYETRWMQRRISRGAVSAWRK